MKKKLSKLIKDYFNSEEKEYQRIYVKPNKFKMIISFIVSLLILYILFFVMHFQVHFIYLTILIVDLMVLIFSGFNLFTKNGIPLPKYVEIEKKDDNKYQV